MGTTPNLGIPYPESSDLVTNGAAAMEALAEAVDDEIGGAWTAYTPTCLSSTGTLGGATATGRWRQVGKTVHVVAVVTITSVGTGSGGLRFSLPVTANDDEFWSLGSGREGALTGKQLAVTLWDADSAYVTMYDNTNLIVGNYQLFASGTYEAA